MQKLDMTLAVLTWRAPKTLEASLSSIEKLLPYFDELVLVCQESDPREIEIGEKYGFRIVALQENVGIQYGMAECFRNASNENVLFYENDLVLKVDLESALASLREASNALNNKQVSFVKLRYLPDNARDKSALFDSYWKIHNNQLRRRLAALIRPKKSLSVVSKSLEYLSEKDITPIGFDRHNDNFLISTTSHNAWENRAVVTTKAFFEKLIAFAESHPTMRSVNGKPDLEHPINCKKNRKWYQSLEVSLLIGVPGLFGHRRFDRAKEDEKWVMVDPLDDGGSVEVS